MKIITYFLWVLFILNGCDNFSLKPEKLNLEKDYKLVKYKNIYSVKLPKYMNESAELHEEASTQYINALKEVYTIVIEEDKSQFINTFKQLEVYDESISPLDNYVKVMIESLSGEEGLEVKLYKKTSINGLPAHIYLMNGRVEGVPAEIAYVLAYIEGENRMYSLTSWTLKNRIDRYRNTFFQIIKSFKEVNG